MKPTDQTVFGYPDGNCLPACLASILEVPLEEIPHFGDEGWFERFNDWLRPQGLYAYLVAWAEWWAPEGIYILSGLSPRAEAEGKEYLHAVVARGWEIIHDPHPSREGLSSRVDCTLLIPFDPSRVNKLPALPDEDPNLPEIEPPI